MQKQIKKFDAKFCKNRFFRLCTKTLVECFIPKKPLDQSFGAIFKKTFFAPNLLLFCIFQIFSTKNAGRNIQRMQKCFSMKPPDRETIRLKISILCSSLLLKRNHFSSQCQFLSLSLSLSLSPSTAPFLLNHLIYFVFLKIVNVRRERKD